VLRTPLAARTAALVLLACIGIAASPKSAAAAVVSPSAGGAAPAQAAPQPEAGVSLESAATRAGQTGRKVAMSLIALAFAIAAIVLAFRRDFKEAAGVFAVGIVAVLLASPAGVSLLRDTVGSLFGHS
jgi:hypothetical protein